MQAYNAQIAVDDDTQVIVAAEITQDANDKEQLAPMVAQVRRNTGTRPVAVSADAGYWSPMQVTDPRAAGIDLHVATGRVRTGASPKSSGGPPGAAEGAGVREQMKQKLDSDVGRAVYKMRKAIGGTGIRTDPGMPGIPAFQFPRSRERAGGMATGLFDPQHPEVVSLRRRIQATGGLNRSREILANTESADEKYVSRSMGAAAISSHGSV